MADKNTVYQLSAQFPGPTSPREFITLLITSDTCLTEASKVGNTIPRHHMVVSIPVSHPDAPPRSNMVRGYYESIEMIREIPMSDGDPETNPVEWVMITRSDPGGGIPRFMVERNVPSSIVQDAVKFLDWACARDDSAETVANTPIEEATETQQTYENGHNLSRAESNGITAGVGTSIADMPSHQRHMSYRTTEADTSLQLHRTESISSSSSSSAESFASAEQFTTAREGLPIDTSIPTPSTLSQQSLPMADDNHHQKGLQKIEEKKEQLRLKLEQAREKRETELQTESSKTEREMQKAAEKHEKEKRKQETKYQKEIRKLEERRAKETRKLLARQQKEADKSQLAKAQRERDEYKQQAGILEQENRLLKKQVGELQHENTTLVSRLGKSEEGIKILKSVRESRTRASSRASCSSGKSSKSTRGKGSSESADTVGRSGTAQF